MDSAPAGTDSSVQHEGLSHPLSHITQDRFWGPALPGRSLTTNLTRHRTDFSEVLGLEG